VGVFFWNTVYNKPGLTSCKYFISDRGNLELNKLTEQIKQTRVDLEMWHRSYAEQENSCGWCECWRDSWTEFHSSDNSLKDTTTLKNTLRLVYNYLAILCIQNIQKHYALKTHMSHTSIRLLQMTSQVVPTWLSLANRNCDFSKTVMGDRNRNNFPVGTIFSMIITLFYEERLNCIFSVHAICTAHDHFIIVTHMLHLSTKNILTCALVIKDRYLPPLSQLRLLFTMN